jgi:ethanolamine transporter
MVDADKNGGVIPLEVGLLICGQIAIVLIGAFPMVKWITKTFGKSLEKIGSMLGMNEEGSAGMVATLANNIAMFNILDKMNPKGKIINVAFAVSAAFVFGDHLGFTAGANSEMIFPVVVGKLTAGITAVILSLFLAPKLLEKVESIKSSQK